GFRFAAQVTKILADRADLVLHERTRSHIVIEEQETGDHEAQRTIDTDRLARAVAVRPARPVKSFWSQSRNLKVLLLTSVLSLGAAGFFIYSARTAKPHLTVRTRTL